MKKLLALILLSVSPTIIGNDLFLHHHTDTVEMGDVITNKIVAQTPVSGKTYTLNNNLSVSTLTNDVAVYMFPNRIAVQQKENSAAYFNNTTVEYTNSFELPEVVGVKNSQFNFSVQGEFYILSDSIKQSMIGTSMCMILFEKAALFVKADDKFTHVYLLDGKATILDNKNSKKKKEIKSGDYLVITPQATLSPKEATVRAASNSISIKDVEDIEKEAHMLEIKSLQAKLDGVLFVNYNTNIFGVKIK